MAASARGRADPRRRGRGGRGPGHVARVLAPAADGRLAAAVAGDGPAELPPPAEPGGARGGEEGGRGRPGARGRKPPPDARDAPRAAPLPPPPRRACERPRGALQVDDPPLVPRGARADGDRAPAGGPGGDGAMAAQAGPRRAARPDGRAAAGRAQGVARAPRPGGREVTVASTPIASRKGSPPDEHESQGHPGRRRLHRHERHRIRYRSTQQWGIYRRGRLHKRHRSPIPSASP